MPASVSKILGVALSAALIAAVPSAAFAGLRSTTEAPTEAVAETHDKPKAKDGGRSKDSGKEPEVASDPNLEVWQAPQAAYEQNRGNPLAGRRWGVYQGEQDQVWGPYLAAAGEEKQQIAKIALRPRTKWYGGFVPDSQIEARVREYIANSQDGDPQALVQLAVFRMTPWEGQACSRAASPAEQASYRAWITNLARGIGSTPTLIVMQPDMPFLWCTPRPEVTAGQLRWATQTLSSLPNTSVYLDAGAADWCENNRGADPERCAGLLMRTGIEFARGFALDSTHYTGPSDNIRHGTAIVRILEREGYGTKHFIIDTAKSGRPTFWLDMIPATPKDLRNNARTCTSAAMDRCVTLGIPPTIRVADERWGLTVDERELAAKYVDGFVWFGRPWLFNQADPFVKQRALDMGRSTPWPGPVV